MRPPDRASKHLLGSCAGLVVAAGSGARLGAGRPKAFVALAGRPMVAWSLDAIAAAGVPRAIVAVPPGHAAAAEDALAAAGDVDAVAVHDAARPLVSPELFGATLAALEHADAAIAAARVTDTIKEAGPDGVVVRTHDRSRLWAIQTPQAFRAAVLHRALDVSDDVLAQATDDAWLVER